MERIVELDCSVGEGGGGMLRCALPLSVATQKPVRLWNFRSGRAEGSKGIGWIHTRFIEAICSLTNSSCDFNWGSTDIDFWPGALSTKGVQIDLDEPKRTFATDDFAVRRQYAMASDAFTSNIDNVNRQGLRGHSIGGFLSGLAPLLALSPGTHVEIVGGTETLGAPFADAVLSGLYPLASRICGVQITGTVERRGCMGRGGGYVTALSQLSEDSHADVTALSSLEEVVDEDLQVKANVYLYGFRGWRDAQAEYLENVLDRVALRCEHNIDVSVVDTPYGVNRWAMLVSIHCGPYVRDMSFAAEELIEESSLGDLVCSRLLAEIDKVRVPSRFIVEQLVPLVAVTRSQFSMVTERSTPHLESVAYVTSAITGREVDISTVPASGLARVVVKGER